MFSTRRVADALAPLGFLLVLDSETEARFVRDSSEPDLFEVVDLNAGRTRSPNVRWGDLAFAGVSIALTPGQFTSPKGMAEWESLTDWAASKTSKQARDWERVVVTEAPAGLDALRQSRGRHLLARTAAARAAARVYLGLVDRSLPISESLMQLTTGASDEERREAARVARGEGIIGVPERACYNVAALLVARYAARVESDGVRFDGKNPTQTPELLWRLHLIASQLLPEPGWELRAGGTAA